MRTEPGSSERAPSNGVAASRTGPRSLPLWPLGFLLLFPLAIAATGLTDRSALSGDPGQFADRMDELFAGSFPYLGFEYEHLPLAIIPMALSRAVSLVIPGDPHHQVFAAIATVGLLITGYAVNKVGLRLGDSAAVNRALVLCATLAPVVVFRLDAFSTALATFALFYLIEQRERETLLIAGAGVALKGWPVVFAPLLWWQGRRRTAAVLAGFTVVLVGVLSLTEGFRSSRAFDGVHQETISGSLVMASRAIRGVAHGIFPTAGALYIEVGQWAVVLNLAIGGLIGLSALRGMRRQYTAEGAVDMAGALTAAVILASPLLSAQFVLWLVPFVALGRDRSNGLYLGVAGAITSLLLAAWWPSRLWWSLLLVGRNALLVLVAIRLVRRVNRLHPPAEVSDGRAGATVAG